MIISLEWVSGVKEDIDDLLSDLNIAKYQSDLPDNGFIGQENCSLCIHYHIKRIDLMIKTFSVLRKKYIHD